MGCWNATCAVTGLPIFDDDEVEVLLVKTITGQDSSSFCEPYSYYVPLPLTFSGQYNDYGAVKNCHGVALDIIVESLRKVLTEREEGENEYHELEVKREDFNIEKLFRLDHEGLLYINTFGKHQFDMREAHRVTHLTIHKHVYDTIVSNIVIGVWEQDPDAKEGSNHTVYKDLVEMRLEYEQYLKDLEAVFKSRESDNDWPWLAHTMNRTVGKTKVGELVGEYGLGSYGLRYPIKLSELLMDLLRMDDEDLEPILDNAIKLSFFSTFMNQARRSWHKPSGSGSQDSETTAQTLAADLTIEMAEIINKRWEK